MASGSKSGSERLARNVREVIELPKLSGFGSMNWKLRKELCRVSSRGRRHSIAEFLVAFAQPFSAYPPDTHSSHDRVTH